VTNQFYLGTESGCIYPWDLQKSAEERDGRVFSGHSSHVTGISVNNTDRATLLQGMFLTSSLDWSVKLWNKALPSPVWSF
jgi:hypothetical protein